MKIGLMQPADRAAWGVLALGYKTFYRTELPESAYEHTWQRLQSGDKVYALGAWLDGRLVGITHYLFQPSVWSDDVCYLQDLFVDEAVRGQGVAAALIEAVAQAARERGAPKLYWLTHETNATARRLYDRVAKHHGFLRYDFALEA
jgi:GNAT superfamily N-acetyltransferase